MCMLSREVHAGVVVHLNANQNRGSLCHQIWSAHYEVLGLRIKNAVVTSKTIIAHTLPIVFLSDDCFACYNCLFHPETLTNTPIDLTNSILVDVRQPFRRGARCCFAIFTLYADMSSDMQRALFPSM